MLWIFLCCGDWLDIIYTWAEPTFSLFNQIPANDYFEAQAQNNTLRDLFALPRVFPPFSFFFFEKKTYVHQTGIIQ